MKLLLCAATEFEIDGTIQYLKARATTSIDILITGIGLTASTYALTKSVALSRPDFILQAGIAGCLNPQLPLTKIVMVENETIGDLGVKEVSFRSLFDMKLLDANATPWKNGKLPNNIEPLKNMGLMAVDGVTVNEISTNKEQIKYYQSQLNASIETMEGAALHYVGLMEKLPFLQIRSLSNFAGERDKRKWVMAEAIASLNIELQRILSKFFSV